MPSTAQFYFSSYKKTWKLSYNGYTYYRNTTIKGVEYYKCDERSICQSKRPAMCRFLSLIMKFQHSTESLLAKISKGGLPRLQRPKYRALNYRLQEICKK